MFYARIIREIKRNFRNKNKLNLNIPGVNQVNWGTKGLRSFRPEVWNSLPRHTESAGDLGAFGGIIGNWDGVSCNFVVCGLEDIY